MVTRPLLTISLIVTSMATACSDSSVTKKEEVESTDVGDADGDGDGDGDADADADGDGDADADADGGPEPDPGPFSTDWGQWLSMAVMPDGSPAITFYDRDRGGIGFAIGNLESGTPEWSFEGVDGYPGSSGLDPGDRGTYTSLAIASDGTAWTSYYDIGAKNLRYAKRHPSLMAWTTGVADTGDGMTKNAGFFSSIALNTEEQPVIAHHDQGAGTLRIARWNGTEFVGSVFDRGDAFTPDTGTEEEAKDANVGQFVRLRIINGIEHLAYYDAANGDLKFAVGSDISVVDTEGDVGQWPDFQKVGDTVHLVYHDVTNQNLKYAKGGPGAWDITTIDTNPYTGADTALYFKDDKPGVIYFEGLSNDLKGATLEETGWDRRTLHTEGAVGFHNEVIQIGGKVYAACFDYTKREVLFSEID